MSVHKTTLKAVSMACLSVWMPACLLSGLVSGSTPEPAGLLDNVPARSNTPTSSAQGGAAIPLNPAPVTAVSKAQPAGANVPDRPAPKAAPALSAMPSTTSGGRTGGKAAVPAVKPQAQPVAVQRPQAGGKPTQMIEIVHYPSTRVAPVVVGGPTPGDELRTQYRDPRMVNYPYDPDKVFEIVTRGGFNTSLAFGAGERVTGVYFSDGCVVIEGGSSGPDDDDSKKCDSGWRVKLTQGRDRLFVKPSVNGIDNEGTVITNRRVYELSFVATDEKQWFKRVTWGTRDASALELEPRSAEPGWRADGSNRFGQGAGQQDDDWGRRLSASQGPKNLVADGRRVELSKLHFDYRLEGRAAFRPEIVFDDGLTTRIKLPANVDEVPILLSLDDRDQAEIVPYYQEGPYFWFHGVKQKLVLKLGRDEVLVTRRGS